MGKHHLTELLAAVASFALALAGCGSSAGQGADAGSHAPDFTVCAGSDAGPYMAGTTATSASGAYTATLVSARTMSNGAPPMDAPAIGLATFVVSFVDASGNAPAGMTVTAEKPYMPLHRHGASTVPAVADQGGGTFDVSQINFFMAGYFQLTLDLQPAAPVATADGGDVDAGTSTNLPPAPDKAVFSICIPQ